MNTFKSLFRQSDLTRAFKAANAAGVEVERVEVDPVTGRIIMIPRDPFRKEGAEAKNSNNPWDSAL